MLHAELHGKTDELASRRERGEDLLTSTVFGTLFAAGAVTELVAWLRRARDHTGAGAFDVPAAVSLDYWFWPRLREAEPDVLIKVGNLLVIVEAKYFSKKHGSGTAEVDQLSRQWRSCASDVDVRGYPARLGDAIRGCETRALVYLVRRRALAKAREELADSLQHESAAAMYVLAWEDLDEVLCAADQGWQRDLREFLRGRRLSAFRGFLTDVLHPIGADLAEWNPRGDVSLAWGRGFAADSGLRLAMLRTKASRFDRARAVGWACTFGDAALAPVAALARRTSTCDRGDHGG